MFSLLNRITWLLSICLGLILLFIDNDLFIVSIVVALAIKYILFSPDFIEECVSELKSKSNNTKVISGIEQTPVLDIKKQEEEEQQVPEALEEIKVEEGEREEEEKTTAQNIAVPVIHQHAPEVSEKIEPNFFEKFFAENLMAKIGGIILFIGVLTFIVGIYSIIGPVTKITIGFIIGFSLFAVGTILDKKGYESESRTVMGVSILVNYLVILGGRHFLGDSSQSDGAFLSAGITFAFLILNTLFAVAVSLVYKSRALLIFAFAAAYINPLLLGTSSSEPYTLVGYTMIVTFGAMYMSYIRKEEVLFPVSFSLAAIMLLIAPWSDASGWLTKLLCINILGALGLYVSTVFKKQFANLYEVLIAGIFFLIGLMGILGFETLNEAQVILMGVSSLGLMNFCYFFMNRGAYLYSLGTVGSVLTLSPMLISNILGDDFIALTVLIIGAFAASNIAVVLTKSKQLLSENLGNLMTGLISGALFLAYMVFILGQEFFPGTLQGMALMGLAVIYAMLAFAFTTQVEFAELKKNQAYQNVFYSIAALSISFFSLAIALVFASHPEVISIVWLLEATVLLFVSQKTQSGKVAFAGLVLFIIGIFRLLPFLEENLGGQYGLLITICIILASFIANLYILFKKENSLPEEFYGAHNITHIIGVGTLIIMSFMIIDIRDEWLALLYIDMSVIAFSLLYRYFGSKGLTYMGNFAILGIYVLHTIANMLALEGGFWGSFNQNIGISLVILASSSIPFIYEYLKDGKIQSNFLLASTCLYGLVITSYYVLQVFEVTFALTLYWGVLAFLVLGYGISKDVLYMRTVGLYLLCLTVGKIFLYDIWQPGVDDGVGFIAFMLTGGLMIALSTMYTKKFGNTLGKDFSPTHIIDTVQGEAAEKIYSDNDSISDAAEKIMKDISNVKTTGIVGVRMYINNADKPVQIRAENLIRIAKLITSRHKKTNFKAGELKEDFDFIEKNYKSSLTPSQYKRIKEIVKQFVDHGGKIEFVS